MEPAPSLKWASEFFTEGLNLKKKHLLEHHRYQTVERLRKGTPVGGQLFGVRLPICNFKF